MPCIHHLFLSLVRSWDTSIGGLTFHNQYLQLSTKLGCVALYGFGETEHANFRHDMHYRAWGMWSRDQPPGVSILLASKQLLLAEYHEYGKSCYDRHTTTCQMSEFYIDVVLNTTWPVHSDMR